MTLPVIIEHAAGQELADQLVRISFSSRISAGVLRNAIALTFDLIAEFPELYERYDGNIRRAVLPRWSLGIFYEATPEAIFVVAILDLCRNPAAIRRRLGLHEEAAAFAPHPTMTLPPGISFDSNLSVVLPERFNVAMPFVDRHLDEGRGAKVAIRTLNETVTYADRSNSDRMPSCGGKPCQCLIST